MPMNTITRRRSGEDIYDKAERLVTNPSNVTTLLQHEDKFWLGIVTGDHGRYKAFAISEQHYEQAKDFLALNGIKDGRLACTCRAGRHKRLCAHSLVAEEMRLRGES